MATDKVPPTSDQPVVTLNELSESMGKHVVIPDYKRPRMNPRDMRLMLAGRFLAAEMIRARGDMPLLEEIWSASKKGTPICEDLSLKGALALADALMEEAGNA